MLQKIKVKAFFVLPSLVLFLAPDNLTAGPLTREQQILVLETQKIAARIAEVIRAQRLGTSDRELSKLFRFAQNSRALSGVMSSKRRMLGSLTLLSVISPITAFLLKKGLLGTDAPQDKSKILALIFFVPALAANFLPFLSSCIDTARFIKFRSKYRKNKKLIQTLLWKELETWGFDVPKSSRDIWLETILLGEASDSLLRKNRKLFFHQLARLSEKFQLLADQYARQRGRESQVKSQLFKNAAREIDHIKFVARFRRGLAVNLFSSLRATLAESADALSIEATDSISVDELLKVPVPDHYKATLPMSLPKQTSFVAEDKMDAASTEFIARATPTLSSLFPDIADFDDALNQKTPIRVTLELVDWPIVTNFLGKTARLKLTLKLSNGTKKSTEFFVKTNSKDILKIVKEENWEEPLKEALQASNQSDSRDLGLNKLELSTAYKYYERELEGVLNRLKKIADEDEGVTATNYRETQIQFAKEVFEIKLATVSGHLNGRERELLKSKLEQALLFILERNKDAKKPLISNELITTFTRSKSGTVSNEAFIETVLKIVDTSSNRITEFKEISEFLNRKIPGSQVPFMIDYFTRLKAEPEMDKLEEVPTTSAKRSLDYEKLKPILVLDPKIETMVYGADRRVESAFLGNTNTEKNEGVNELDTTPVVPVSINCSSTLADKFAE